MDNLQCPDKKLESNVHGKYHDVGPKTAPAIDDPIKLALASVSCTPDSVIARNAQLAAATEAKTKLAQEALLADPAKMAKIFPRLQADINYNLGHNPGSVFDEIHPLNKNDLEQAPKYVLMSQDEKNLLHVLTDNYDLFNQDLPRRADPYYQGPRSQEGIDEKDMLLINKAVNRGAKDDPIASYWNERAVMTGLGTWILAEIRGVFIPSQTWAGMAATTIGGFAVGYGGRKIEQYALSSHTKKSYDDIKEQYLTFKDAYSKDAGDHKK